MSQLKVGKRKLNNMRRDGEISYTYFGKSVMYLKQELAAMLKAKVIVGNKSILKQLNVELLKNATGCYWCLATRRGISPIQHKWPTNNLSLD